LLLEGLPKEGGQRTMNNTIQRYERPGRPEPPDDYFLVIASVENWCVSREMAQAIEASLNQEPVPQWVTFVDLTGARIRVRTRLIGCIHQCTAEQRALARAIERAQRAEWKADRGWEEDR
jgi:hypothetical protein